MLIRRDGVSDVPRNGLLGAGRDHKKCETYARILPARQFAALRQVSCREASRAGDNFANDNRSWWLAVRSPPCVLLSRLKLHPDTISWAGVLVSFRQLSRVPNRQKE